MKKILFQWNGTKSQAAAYVESVKRTSEAKAGKARRASLWSRYAERKAVEDAKRAIFWNNK